MKCAMRRRLLAFGFVTSSFLCAITACNAIVGVTDVRLKKDSGAGDDADNFDGQGDDSGNDTGPPPPANILEVALGNTHTCARKPDGTVKCWGDDTLGQTGTNGAGDGGGLLEPTATGVTDAIHISSGKNHTCIIRKSGQAQCWGSDADGQLGDGTTNAKSPVAVDVKGLTDAISICAGGNFSCAVKKAGGAVCWGDGLSGQLGAPGVNSSSTPVSVVNLTGLTSISCGDLHACAVNASGQVACWGDNQRGELGTGGTGGSNPTPTPLTSLGAVFSVAAASRGTCALRKNGDVYCWGSNELGQLGTGTASIAPNPNPVQVINLKATALWAGADHACAVKSGGTGTIVCWGAGYFGQLGDKVTRDDASTPAPTPVDVSGALGAIGVGTGGNHSCAPLSTGSILCWGANEHGQVGDRQTTPQFTPDSVVGYP
jgi:alpha-tubulin suppressor-like RCC1 family protein